jgi:predicted DNA-binding transcriptional regulator YafY
MSSIAKIRRLLHLLERLQSGRTYNAAQLADFCSVSRRTIFRDLKTLQESGIPILYDSQRQGYWLTSGDYLPPTDLTLAETLSLLILAQELGARERGIPFQEVARDAALKLQSNLPEHLRNYVGEFVANVEIQSEPHADLKAGKIHYQRMIDAITNRCKIRIRYESLYEQSEIRTLVSPYRLLFQRHTWYVIGRSSLHRAVRTFHLGRILESELTEDRYEIPPRFNLNRYLGNAWNLIRERGARTEVVVRFQPLVARNVAEVSWHKTQRIVWNEDGTMDFHVTVDGIHEISWWVLGYGDQAEVLRPDALRKLIAERVQRMAKCYAKR